MRKIVSTIMAALLSLGCAGSLVGCSDSKSEKTKVKVYEITSTADVGGTLVADKSKAEEGSAVTFTLTTQEGYGLKSFTINGGEVVPTLRSEQDGVCIYVYTVKNALRDYAASASFGASNLTISFTGEGVSGIADKQGVYGGKYGELPTPAYQAGKRFLGWKNQSGQIVNQATTILEYGDIQLTAVWDSISDEEKALLKPFSVSTSYFDSAATSYGVVWHTATEPVSPVVQYIKGNGTDFSAATTVPANGEEWLHGEYTVNCVVENLDFGQEYTVRFGDEAADVWSDRYTFTTRQEQIDVAKFFYVADTQEERKIANRKEEVKLSVEDTYFAQTMRDAVTRFPDANFIAHGGDMVNYGAASWCWQEMLGSVEEYLFNLPLQVAAGNHEDSSWYTAGHETMNKLFHVDAPEDDNVRGDYYSFDYGPMHFIVLRSNDVFVPVGDGTQNKLGSKQVAWLRADVAKAKQNPNVKWVVTMIHEGPIAPDFVKSGSNYHQATLGAQLIPLCDELDIDLMLYGHNHYLDSTYPLVWDENTPATLADGLTVKPVTTTTAKETYDGVQVDTFTYLSGTEKRGTVYHQTGTAGHQYDYMYKLADLETNIAQFVNYRMLLSGKKDFIDDKARTMYSYIEVTANQLVVRTYGVDVQGLSAQAENSTDYGKYLDGFMLKK